MMLAPIAATGNLDTLDRYGQEMRAAYAPYDMEIDA